MHHNEQITGTILFYSAQQELFVHFLSTYIFFLCTTYSGLTVCFQNKTETETELSSSRADCELGCELDSVMGFGPSGAIQLASRSLAGLRPARELFCDLLVSQTGSRAGSLAG